MKRHAPAAQRNRGPILEVLRRVLPERGHALEVASGSGEHVVAFAQGLPGWRFSPSDLDPTARASVDAWVAELGLANVAPAVALDACGWPWPVTSADAVLCSNMIHISPWETTLGLLRGAGEVLRSGGTLVLYGPFYVDGQTAPSNVAFDDNLRGRDPSWGVRELTEIQTIARTHGLVHEQSVAMPANNLTVVFRRD